MSELTDSEIRFLKPVRDPFVDRARSAYLYVVALIAFVQGVAIPVAAMFGRVVEPMSLTVAAVLVAPAVAHMFGKSAEQAIKAWKAVRP